MTAEGLMLAACVVAPGGSCVMARAVVRAGRLDFTAACAFDRADPVMMAAWFTRCAEAYVECPPAYVPLARSCREDVASCRVAIRRRRGDEGRILWAGSAVPRLVRLARWPEGTPGAAFAAAFTSYRGGGEGSPGYEEAECAALMTCEAVKAGMVPAD